MSTPNGDYIRNKLPRFSDFPDPSVFESIQFQPNADGHIFLLYEDEVRTLSARAGLTVKEFHYVANSLINGHMKLRTIITLPTGKIRAHNSTVQIKLSTHRSQKLSTSIVALLVKQ